MESNNSIKTLQEEVKSSVEQNTDRPKVTFVKMKVSDKCQSLNVRKEPSLTSEILRELKSGTILNINLEKSTNNFYYVASTISVINSNGEINKTPIHGYSLKEYICE